MVEISLILQLTLHVLNDIPSLGTYETATGMTTAQGEALGDASTNTFAEMAFSIEKHTVTARTRALKASTQWNLHKT